MAVSFADKRGFERQVHHELANVRDNIRKSNIQSIEQARNLKLESKRPEGFIFSFSKGRKKGKFEFEYEESTKQRAAQRELEEEDRRRIERNLKRGMKPKEPSKPLAGDFVTNFHSADSSSEMRRKAAINQADMREYKPSTEYTAVQKNISRKWGHDPDVDFWSNGEQKKHFIRQLPNTCNKWHNKQLAFEAAARQASMRGPYRPPSQHDFRDLGSPPAPLVDRRDWVGHFTIPERTREMGTGRIIKGLHSTPNVPGESLNGTKIPGEPLRRYVPPEPSDFVPVPYRPGVKEYLEEAEFEKEQKRRDKAEARAIALRRMAEKQAHGMDY